MIYIPQHNKVVYPDVAVVEGEFETQGSTKAAITNPLLIVEVLSRSTEGYDRGGKFDSYSTIPSLREYVLVAQDRMYVETFYLPDENRDFWTRNIPTGDPAEITLQSIGFSLRLEDIYKRVKFDR